MPTWFWIIWAFVWGMGLGAFLIYPPFLKQRYKARKYASLYRASIKQAPQAGE